MFSRILVRASIYSLVGHVSSLYFLLAIVLFIIVTIIPTWYKINNSLLYLLIFFRY
jgi:hypothetical protein